MATLAAAPQGGTRQPAGGAQKRLLRSISRFLSGGNKQAKPKQAEPARRPSAAATTRATSYGSALHYDEPDYSRSHTSSQSQPLPPASRRARSGTGELSGGTSLADTFDDEYSLSRLSALSGADTDASVRPISPSSHAASSVISRTDDSASNASLAPTHGTFKSYASTKPTTLSIDSAGAAAAGGANRIAVVPGTGAGSLYQPSTATQPLMSASAGVPSATQPSGNPSGPGITFDLTSASPQLSGQPNLGAISSGTSTTEQGADITKVPRHTQAHPRNNPHPASPPPDNASMLTLASSSFAPSISRHERREAGSATGTPSNLGAHSGGTWQGGGLNALRAWKREGDGPGADEDASVRVLAGSRRASDESLGGTSTWSAAIGRSVGVAPSIRTVGTTGTGDMLGALEREDSATGPLSTSASGDIEVAQIVQEAKIGEVQAPTPRSDLTPTEEMEAPSPSLPQASELNDAVTPHVDSKALPDPVPNGSWTGEDADALLTPRDTSAKFDTAG
ncbi:hypothetical protein OIV83_002860 [Microbotryomycetes sp. JL201]|nr:hypothetical protein OIV83_002860 [Microbotryomycetes sp. JL201]